MRSAPSIFAAVTILGAASWASAAEPVVTAAGTIKTVDMLHHSITLTNGSTYKFDKGVNIEGKKAGQKVTLTFRRMGTTLDVEASAITLDAD